MRECASRLIADRGGAVAATVALSLFALIAIGGVAFDYARMASLDTELQNAADQAALAGVTQLDGQAGACLRAATAANAMKLPTDRAGPPNEADLFLLGRTDTGVPAGPGAIGKLPADVAPVASPPLGPGGSAAVGPIGFEKEYGHVL